MRNGGGGGAIGSSGLRFAGSEVEGGVGAIRGGGVVFYVD